MNDQSSATLKAQALLSTIGEKHDPAEVFFELFPTPEEIHGATDIGAYEDLGKRIASVLDAVKLFVKKHGRRSADPDFVKIYNHFVRLALRKPQCWMVPLRNAIAYVALMKSRDKDASSEGTKKDQLMTYYLWRAHGSKDETSPLKAEASTSPIDAASHDFLPSSRVWLAPCSECGNAEASGWCTECCILKSSKIVFATFYCHGGCKRDHWWVHEPACNETRALRRAVTIFTELWLGFLQLTEESKIESVIEENGLIEVVFDSSRKRGFLGESMFRQFPRHLFDSEEQALACMTRSSGSFIAEEGRILFELVMRPCAVVEAVHFQPKNVHKAFYYHYHNSLKGFLTYFHLVFRLTLPSGLRFAFDPAGTHNGWQENLAPWDTYEQHRIHFITKTVTLDAWGPEQRKSERERESLSNGKFNVRMERGRKVRLAFMAKVVDEYLGREFSGTGMEELLHRLPYKRFEAVRASLVNGVMEDLRRYQRDIDEGPTEKLYFDRDFQLCVTQNSEDFDFIKKVWFTEEEYWELLGDGSGHSTLKKAWSDRFEKAIVELKAGADS